MKKIKTLFWTMLFGALMIFPAAGFAHAAGGGAMELVGLLTSQLGVTEKQATGGAGSLFQAAKNSLSTEDYSQVSEAVAGIDSLVEAAPAVSESTGGISKKVSGVTKGLGSLTKTAQSVNQMAAVKDQFSQLGLDTDMVSRFVPVILDYAKSQGGQTVMNLLKGVWQ